MRSREIQRGKGSLQDRAAVSWWIINPKQLYMGEDLSKPAYSAGNSSGAQYKGIELLSEPSDYSMANEWYEFAQSNHFWIRWRFECLRKLLPTSYEWGQVLDVGCGNGVVRRQIEEYYGCIADGCDLNLSILRAALPGKGSLYFYDVNQRRENFKERFTTILLLDVLEHIKDPVNFFNSISFHLKKGGSVILNVPAFQFFYSAYDEVQGHLKRYTSKLLKEELQSAGFVIEKNMYWGMSMAPFLFVRKFMINFFPKEKVMSIGFQPQNRYVDFIFQSLRNIEYNIFPNVPLGTSLMAIAKKKI